MYVWMILYNITAAAAALFILKIILLQLKSLLFVGYLNKGTNLIIFYTLTCREQQGQFIQTHPASPVRAASRKYMSED